MTERLVTKGVGGSFTQSVYQIPGALPSAANGFFLTSDTTGQLSWSNAPKVKSGFENRTDSSLGMSGTNLQVTTGGSYNFWLAGVMFTKNSTQQVPIAADHAQHYVYFDSAGTLQVSTTPWVISDFYSTLVPVCTVYRSSANYSISDERHGLDRDILGWHEWAHDTIGCQYESGLAGVFDDTTFSIEQGVVADEDLEADTGGVKTSSALWYRQGGGAYMVSELGVATPYKAIAGALQYDAAGVLTPVPLGRFINSWFYCTTDINYPIYVVVGQAHYGSLGAANDDPAPALPLMTTREWKLIYRVVYRNVGGTPTYRSAADYRMAGTGPSAAVIGGSHAALVDRSLSGQHPLTAIEGTTPNAFIYVDASGDLAQTTAWADYEIIQGVTGGAPTKTATPQFTRIGIGVAAHASILQSIYANSVTTDPLVIQTQDGLGDNYVRLVRGTKSFAFGIDYAHGAGADVFVMGMKNGADATLTSTPMFAMDSSYRIMLGGAAAGPMSGDWSAKWYAGAYQLYSTNVTYAGTVWQPGLGLGGYGNNVYGTRIGLFRTRSTSGLMDANTVLRDDDSVFDIVGWGSDGAEYQEVARISAEVDGTPGAGDMPGRLCFWTTPDGSGTAVERWRIDNEGVLTGYFATTTKNPTIDMRQSLSGDVGLRVGCGNNRSYFLGIDNDASTYTLKISTAASASAELGTGDLWALESGGNMLAQVPTVRCYQNGDVAIPDGAWTAVAFGGADTYDTDTMHDPATNNSRIYAKTAGKYQITYSVFLEANAGVWRGTIYVSGAPTSIYAPGTEGSAGYSAVINFSCEYSLTAGQYVECMLYQDSGGPLNAFANYGFATMTRVST